MKNLGWLVAPIVGMSAILCASRADAAITTNGEIVIMEGDATTVSGTDGAYYLGPDNIQAIADQFYTVYSDADKFDMLIVYPTFVDQMNGGAYYTSQPLGHTLQGFINMNQLGFWPFGMEQMSVLGQEFGHRWVAFDNFVDPTTGMISGSMELLGRMAAHWSSLLETQGSVIDGVDWKDNGDGTFTVQGIMTKYGDIDLYEMGFYDKTEVPPFFLLRNASGAGGAIGNQGIWDGSVNVGTVATATKVDLTIDDIIAADGPLPPVDMRQKDFRVAFIVLTAPGESAASAPHVQELDQTRLLWNDVYATWTLGRGTMCSDVSAPCDIPRAAFASGKVTEGMPSNGNGIVEPGEHANVEIDWTNTGTATASGAIAKLTVDPTSGIAAPDPQPVPDIPVGGMMPTVFDVLLPSKLACGVPTVFKATATIGIREWNGQVSMIPGIIAGDEEHFATDAGWRANKDMTDTVPKLNAGAWDYGIAEETTQSGLTLQPAGGRGGPMDNAWWTGRKAGFTYNSNDVDMGKTTLTSATYDITGKNAPVLRYYLWYQDWNFNATPPAPSSGDDFLVEVSVDGGNTWLTPPIDDVADGKARIWEQRDVPLAGKIPAGTKSVTFRFTAQDLPPLQNLVEAGIDDVSIWSLSTTCGGGGGGGCGCSIGGRRATRGALAGGCLTIFGVFGVVVVRRRRGRPRLRT